MTQKYGYRLEELESMMPWEREVYLVMLLQHIRDEKERLLQEKMTKKYM